MYKPTNIEIGLINKCNLKCTLCARNTTKSYVKKQTALDYNSLVKFLEAFQDLEFVSLVGSVTEPTLYPEFLSFIKYLKSRGIRIEISTNGTTYKEPFWEALGSLLTQNDKVIFGIDGSTQELLAEYRVGSSLEKILKRHSAFKNASNAISILQFIIFEHNFHDIENIKNLAVQEGFSDIKLEHCYTVRPKDFSKPPIHKPIKKIRDIYKYLEESHSIDNKPKTCRSEKAGDIYLNHNGQIMPCCHFNDTILDNNLKCPTIYNSTFEEIIKYCAKIIEEKDVYYECNMFCSNFNINLQNIFNVDP